VINTVPRNKKNNLIKKVLFVSHFNYLNIPVFQPVMTKLQEMRLDTLFLYLPGNSYLPGDKPVDLDSLILYQELPLKLENRYSQNAFRKAVLFVKLIWNYRLIDHFIGKEKPCAVVVGSDLGNVHIRFLLAACLKDCIPVFVIYNCDIPYMPIRRSHSKACVLQSSILSILSCFPTIRFLHAVFFKNDIPGKYHHDATICVLSENVRNRLIRYGIQPERIVNTGMPTSENHLEKKETFLTKLGMPQHARVIGWFAGPIGEVYGVEEEKKVCDALRSMLEDLPDDVFLVIKIHPRETPTNEAMIYQIFNTQRCRIIKSMTAEDMIPHIDLFIGQFSRVLISAAAKGKRFLSINHCDDPRSLLIGEERNTLEISTLDNLTTSVLMALNDFAFQVKMDQVCRAVVARYTVTDGSNPAVTIASLIYRSMPGSTR
jgi:hypothetical protein